MIGFKGVRMQKFLYVSLFLLISNSVFAEKLCSEGVHGCDKVNCSSSSSEDHSQAISSETQNILDFVVDKKSFKMTEGSINYISNPEEFEEGKLKFLVLHKNGFKREIIVDVFETVKHSYRAIQAAGGTEIHRRPIHNFLSCLEGLISKKSALRCNDNIVILQDKVK